MRKAQQTYKLKIFIDTLILMFVLPEDDNTTTLT